MLKRRQVVADPGSGGGFSVDPEEFAHLSFQCGTATSDGDRETLCMIPPLPNNDPDVDPEEIAAAADETPAASGAPEVTRSTRNLTEWDEAPSSVGSAAPQVRPEDDVSPAELLIAEGLDEADRDRRLAAVDPDFEP